MSLRSGNVVAFPTETVYGLGADISQPQAIQKIFESRVGLPAIRSSFILPIYPNSNSGLKIYLQLHGYWPNISGLVH